jgi:polyhydroxybutyrate depolymerase
MRRLLTAAFACLLFAAPALAERTTPAKPETLTVSAGGTQREAILYAPDAATGPRPVVLVFHGGGGGAEWMANKSALLTRTLTGAGYAVVYMNGSTKRRTEKLRTWNAVHCCAYAARAKINEAAYADAVLNALDAKIEMDRTRIFLMGHSNGAMLSYRLAGQMQTTPRAIAPISGAIFADQPEVPDRTSIFIYHAVDDEALSYDGNPEDKAERWRTAPHLGFVKAEAKLAELKTCAEPTGVPAVSGVTVTARTCAGDSSLVAVTGASGGHEWPSRPPGYSIEQAILGFFNAQR